MALLFNELSVDICGNHSAEKLLLDEYSLLPTTTKKPCLSFNVTGLNIEPDLHGQTVGDKIYVSKNSVFINNRSFDHNGDTGFALKIEGHPFTSKYLEIDAICDPDVISTTLKKRIIEWFYIRKNWNYLSKLEVTAKNLIYDALEPILHLRMLQINRGFLHASSIMYGNDVMLFPGGVGAGKTGICIELIDRGGYKFMSDDLSMIGTDGMAYVYPKRMQIYAHNTQGNPNLHSRIMKDRGFSDKLQWKLHERFRGPSKARRRVSPVTVFGRDNIGDYGKISKVVHVVRCDNSYTKFIKSNSVELADRCANEIAYEFSNFLNYMRDWHTIDPAIPTADEVINASKYIYEQAFNDAECYSFIVPRNSSPSDLVNEIESILND